jgi:hypothetical protein
LIDALGQKCRAGQVSHTVRAAAGLKSPAEQLMHWTSPAVAYVPGLHGAGVTEPFAHECPAGHSLQSAVPGLGAK